MEPHLHCVIIIGAGSVVVGKETAKVFIENGKLHAQPIIKDI